MISSNGSAFHNIKDLYGHRHLRYSTYAQSRIPNIINYDNIKGHYYIILV